MLILTRYEGQQIMIGEGTIEVRVLEVRGETVKLGIVAAPEVKVLRSELKDRAASGEEREGPNENRPPTKDGGSDAGPGPDATRDVA
jgi:carbon storage regulator